MKNIFLGLIIVSSLLVFLFSQQEIRVRIDEGVPLIPVAINEMIVRGTVDKNLQEEITTTLWSDLNYSRVFKLIPREHLNYIPRLTDPEKINFKDWASIQAKILIITTLEELEDRITFRAMVFDVINEKFIFGKNYAGKKEYARLFAHRFGDDLLRHFGEKPLFQSKIAFISERDGNKELYMMDYDGARQTRLTFNNTIEILPSWSSDNEKILYTSYRRNSPELFLYEVFSGKTTLISSGGINYGADWSWNGSFFVYTSSKDGNTEIYLREVSSGKERRLTFNSAIDTSPSLSPNDMEIAFISNRSGSPQLYIMDIEGGNVRRITFEGSYHDSPAWSPDGGRIAFVSRIDNNFDIYIYQIRSNSLLKLTENSKRNENPTWSPDGRHLVFASDRSGSYQLYSIDYDGRNLKQLTFQGENKMPRWQKKVD